MKSPHISICVCTYRRIDMLRRLLDTIASQDTLNAFTFSTVVIDNDAAGTARPVVQAVQRERNVSIAYDVEHVRTIPAARNHALRLASGDYIAIIDDDEFVPPDWLATLFQAIQTFNVDGALGPVYPFFDGEPPRWLLKSEFCERPVIRTGTLLHWYETRTGNVLLKRDVFDRDQLVFDEHMTTGGTDREFFKQAMRRGRRFVAVAEAPVFEVVPPDRWAKTYWLKRALVNGYNAYTTVADRLHGIARPAQAIKCVIAVCAYAGWLPFACLLGTHVWMKCLERGAHHLSRLCAMGGIQLLRRRSF